MNISETPEIKAFIIEAIRDMRRNVHQMKPGDKAGLGIHRLYKVLNSTFEDRQIREALNSLIASGDIYMVISSYMRYPIDEIVNKHRAQGKVRLSLVAVIPDSMPLNEVSWWSRGEQYEYVDKNYMITNKAETYTMIRVCNLYVVHDGVSQNVKTFLMSIDKQRANKIAELMKK